MPRLLAFVALLAFAYTATAGAQSIPPEGPTFIITASHNTLSPSSIDVNVNQLVTLKLVADSGIHAIESPELGIPPTSLAPGMLKTITFRPKKAGTYRLHCMVMARSEHVDMHVIVHVH
jgi:heme/copper-type cytochrome/quinol oxidase subunit 2